MHGELIPEHIEYIVIHCSDSPHGRWDDASTIHRWHLERGWSCIGYHYVIPEFGDYQAGRPEYMMGAHARGFNDCSLGICIIGPNEDGIFFSQQFSQLLNLLILLSKRYPDAQIVGHNFLDHKKTCPKFDVFKYLDDHPIDHYLNK